MKLSDLLTENTLEIKDALTLWNELKSAATTYISSSLYSAKYDEDKKQYLIYTDTNNVRKLYTTMSKAEFGNAFTSVQSNPKLDAEGFTTYRLSDTIEAIQYNGDTVLVNLNGKEVRLNRGDYLTRSVSGKSFEYAVESKTFFNKTFTKA